jgi:hypothetical protein
MLGVGGGMLDVCPSPVSKRGGSGLGVAAAGVNFVLTVISRYVVVSPVFGSTYVDAREEKFGFGGSGGSGFG